MDRFTLIAMALTSASPQEPPKAETTAEAQFRRKADEVNALAQAGRHSEAIALQKQAIAEVTGTDADSRMRRIKLLRVLADLQIQMGDYAAGLTSVDQALLLARAMQHGEQIEYLSAYRLTPLRVMGRQQEVIDEADRMIATAGPHFDPTSGAGVRVLQNKIAALAELGRLDDAIDAAASLVVRLDQRMEAPGDKPRDLRYLHAVMLETRAALNLMNGKAEPAIPDLKRARAGYETLHPTNPAKLANVDETLASALSQAGRHGEALALRQALRARTVGMYLPGSREETRNAVSLAWALFNAGKADEAFQHSVAALEQVRLLNRSSLAKPLGSTEEDRLIVAQLASLMFRNAAQSPQSPERATAALLSAHELQSARALPAVLRAVRGDEPRLEDWLKRRSAAVEEAKASLSASEGALERRKKSFQKLAALDAELDTILAARGHAAAFNAGDLQAALAPGEAILVVQETDCCTVTALVTRGAIRFQSAEVSASDLCQAVSAVRELYGQKERLSCLRDARGRTSRGTITGGFPNGAAASELIYRAALQPHRAALQEVEMLYISSAGSLSALPWAGLEVARGSDGPTYLVERTATANLGSLAAFARRASGGSALPQGQELRYLGVGAPCVGSLLGPDCAGRMARADKAISIAMLRGSGSGDGVRTADINQSIYLSPLAASAFELKTVAAAVPGKDVLLIGPEATSEGLKKAGAAGRPQVLHFATHGLAPGEFGLDEPALVLTPDISAPGGPRARLLKASEVAQMDLGADLVILSGCSTASDSAEHETGTISGFTRAFMQSGARTLVTTHGAVDDLEMSRFISRMMETRFATGKSYAEAMRQTAIRSISEGADPGVWALPFVTVLR